MLYPKEIDLNVSEINRFVALFKTAYQEISEEILSATNFGVANRKAILSQIKKILADLGEKSLTEFGVQITDYYKEGADYAVAQLNRVGAEVAVSEGFNRIHLDAIKALISDASSAFGESISGVYRSANQLLNKAVKREITTRLAIGKIGGKDIKAIKDMIIGIMQEQGIASLIDKGGRKWSLDTYAEMLIRTKAVEARNMGLLNRVVENDYDLVQVSSHNSSCEICSEWEGEILSITGNTPGYPSLQDAEDDGLFHPNCRHAINVLTPSLSDQTSAYDWQTGEIS